jgi:hypothetical protein
MINNGDFNGLGVQLQDPVTGQNFTNNQIPTGMLSPIAVALTKYLPVSKAAANGFVTYAIPAPVVATAADRARRLDVESKAQYLYPV